jgi:hypothetical protein
MSKKTFLFMAAFLSAGFIFAQEKSKPIEEKKITKDVQLKSERLIADKFKERLHHEMIMVKSKMAHVGLLHSVKGAPYSGDAVTETTQALPDGNRIYRKNRVSLYRDGEGRVRREEFRTVGQSSPAGETPETILIMDPVKNVNYILDVKTAKGRMTPLGKSMITIADAKSDAKMEVFATGPDHQMFDKIERARKEAPSFMVRPHGKENSSLETKTESLGKQIIEGIEAEGTRTITTIPAGEIGNELPIECVSERWYSPELQTNILTRRSDPRVGETIYRLTNIHRGEPSASMFEVPAGYTLAK